MFLGDDNARGMYDATIERLSTLPDWRIDEIGSSAGSAGDRDTLFVHRLYETQADGHVEHRMMYISFRRVASFADRNKLDAVLRDPRARVRVGRRRAAAAGRLTSRCSSPDWRSRFLPTTRSPTSPLCRSARAICRARRRALRRRRRRGSRRRSRRHRDADAVARRARARDVSREEGGQACRLQARLEEQRRPAPTTISILRLNRAVADVVRRESRGRADILDPWKFFPTYINRNISLSLDALHLEESIDDLKEDDGATDSPQLQRLLVDVVLDQLCDHLAEDRADEARQQFAAKAVSESQPIDLPIQIKQRRWLVGFTCWL
jgi:hypothetical protein